MSFDSLWLLGLDFSRSSRGETTAQKTEKQVNFLVQESKKTKNKNKINNHILSHTPSVYQPLFLLSFLSFPPSFCLYLSSFCFTLFLSISGCMHGFSLQIQWQLNTTAIPVCLVIFLFCYVHLLVTCMFLGQSQYTNQCIGSYYY